MRFQTGEGKEALTVLHFHLPTVVAFSTAQIWSWKSICVPMGCFMGNGRMRVGYSVDAAGWGSPWASQQIYCVAVWVLLLGQIFLAVGREEQTATGLRYEWLCLQESASRILLKNLFSPLTQSDRIREVNRSPLLNKLWWQSVLSGYWWAMLLCPAYLWVCNTYSFWRLCWPASHSGIEMYALEKHLQPFQKGCAIIPGIGFCLTWNCLSKPRT